MTARTLSSAAAVCGLPDPMEIADRLSALTTSDVEACSHYAGALAVALFQGAHTSQDAAALTGIAWSTGTAAATAMGQTGMAAMSARAVMTTLSGALDGFRATLQHVQSLVHAVIADAEGALQQAGFDAATGHASSAPTTQLPFPLSSPTGTSIDGTAGAITPIVSAALERLRSLQARLDTALQDLLPATRVDPRDLLQRLPALPVSSTAGGTGPAETAGPATAMVADTVAAGVGALGAAVGGLLAGGGAGGSTTSVPATAALADSEARARLTRDLESTDPVTHGRAKHIQTALDQAAAAGQTVQLLSYTPATPTSQGTAAIGIGDMATADSVTTMVPGVHNSADDMSGALGDAQRLQAEAHRRNPGESTAVVAWFGYDIPLTSGYAPDPAGNVAAMTDDEAAIAGGAALTTDLARFRRYAPDTARQVVIGHSMGSVVVSAAAAQGAHIDDLVLLGSPGASRLVDSARSYPNVAPGHTWVLALDDPVTGGELDILAVGADFAEKLSKMVTIDPSAKLALVNDLVVDPLGSQLGPDPADADFGATLIAASSTRPEHSSPEWLTRTAGMTGVPTGFQVGAALGAGLIDDFQNHPQGVYLSGTALTAIADITAGHTADVPTKPGR